MSVLVKFCIIEQLVSTMIKQQEQCAVCEHSL